MLAMDGGFPHVQRVLLRKLLDAPATDVGEWQSQDVSDKPHMVTHEVRNASFEISLPESKDELASITGANLPWAEDHFQERVGGVPVNPPPSAAYWPFAQKGHEEHTDDEEKFSHTYPERMWPKNAAGDVEPLQVPRAGIRYAYGDLQDVINQLAKSPYTRQAYLPIWFPEDTGNVMGERVPCSLGYHFLIRGRELHVTYMIRSCDFVRHFPDDVYMAARLAQWVCHKVNVNVEDDALPVFVPASLTMHTMSMHIFAGDVPILQKKVNS